MNAFDVPSIDFHNQPFEDRYSALLENISHTHPFSVCLFFYSSIFYYSSFLVCLSYYIQLVVPRVRLKNDKQVNYFLQNIINDGGEGVVVRKVNSIYEHGRTPSLLKLKVIKYYFLDNTKI